jgi:hypothetical protein
VDPVEVESGQTDEDYKNNEATLDDLDDEEQPLDEEDLNDFDEEEIGPLATPTVKKEKKKASIKSEDGALMKTEVENEADDTVFIDNLPKDERSIRIMLKDVNRHIRDLERKFFEEEDSEAEEELKHDLENENVSAAEHNHRLE